ncbi:fructose-bisphosphatase class III, partial [Salmonella enterica subsp. enterica serovar Cerro]
LIEYAERYYKPSTAFAPRLTEGEYLSQEECDLLNKLQQATAILQFKLESQLIARRSDFHLEERDVLHFINYDEERITLKGKQYDLQEFQAPTVDPVQPEQLTDEEEILLKKLLKNFQASQKLKKHIDFLLEKGSMYLSY